MTSTIDPTEVVARDARGRVRVSREQRAEPFRLCEADVDRAMTAFEPVWEGLNPGERGRLLDLLVERVDYDGAAGKIAIRFRPTGIRTLAAGEIA